MFSNATKAEATLKIKKMNEQTAQDEELKAVTKKTTKAITEAIAGLKEDQKKQLEVLKQLGSKDLPSKITLLERTQTALEETAEKIKNEKDKYSRDALHLIEEKGRYEGGIEEIKRTIVNIKKTVADSIVDQAKKRVEIQDNLEKSLGEIRSKIKEFSEETENFSKENVELQAKIDDLKSKLGGVEESYKLKNDEKDEEIRGEKEELTVRLKQLQVEVEQATQLSKEYTALQKKNFDNKIAIYLKTKKFPELSSSFESSADTLNSCKLQLQKGVQRMNTASQIVSKTTEQNEQVNNLILAELGKQKEKETKIEEIKKQKDAVRAAIIVLQNKDKKPKN